MTARQYTTGRAFKQALEHRLKASSATGADFARRRQLLVFERFLARVAQVAGETVTLKADSCSSSASLEREPRKTSICG